MDKIRVTSTARQVQAACGYDGAAAFKWERFNTITKKVFEEFVERSGSRPAWSDISASERSYIYQTMHDRIFRDGLGDVHNNVLNWKTRRLVPHKRKASASAASVYSRAPLGSQSINDVRGTTDHSLPEPSTAALGHRLPAPSNEIEHATTLSRLTGRATREDSRHEQNLRALHESRTSRTYQSMPHCQPTVHGTPQDAQSLGLAQQSAMPASFATNVSSKREGPPSGDLLLQIEPVGSMTLPPLTRHTSFGHHHIAWQQPPQRSQDIGVGGSFNEGRWRQFGSNTCPSPRR